MQTEPSIVTITSTLMDISTRASNGSKTEENLNIISGTLDNVANVIETENIGINEMVSKKCFCKCVGQEWHSTDMLECKYMTLLFQIDTGISVCRSRVYF